MTAWAQLGANLDDLRAAGRWPSGPTTTLEVIGQTTLEAPHERLIAWLLDPLGNHGLGIAVLANVVSGLRTGRVPSPGDLSRARVKTQVGGASARPDIVVTMPSARLVIELKIKAREGIGQTRRQANDYAGTANVTFVFLTRGSSPPTDPRFEHLSLLDLYGCLRRALVSSPSPARPTHARGRAVAADYAATLERMLGLDPIDQEAARYWLRHAREIDAAEAAAQRLLAYLHEHTEQKFADLAAQLGEGVRVVSCTDEVPAQWNTSYRERAVLITDDSWMPDGLTARLGVGLGISTEPRADWTSRGAHRPFWGVYAKDQQVRDALSAELSQMPNLPTGGGEGWGPWVKWWYLDLEPPDNGEILAYYAATVANHVGQFWQCHKGALDRTLRSASGEL